MNTEITNHDVIQANYALFKQHLDSLMESNPGEFALVGNHQVEVFGCVEDALAKGEQAFPPGEFLVQEIAPQTPVAATFGAL